MLSVKNSVVFVLQIRFSQPESVNFARRSGETQSRRGTVVHSVIDANPTKEESKLIVV